MFLPINIIFIKANTNKSSGDFDHHFCPLTLKIVYQNKIILFLIILNNFFCLAFAAFAYVNFNDPDAWLTPVDQGLIERYNTAIKFYQMLLSEMTKDKQKRNNK